MNVLLMNAGHIGPDYYRVTEPARAIREAGLGIDITISRGLTTTMKEPPGGGPARVTDVDARGADVVVLQLPKTDEMRQCIRILQAQGVAVVAEFDDLLSAVPFGHSGHPALIRAGMAKRALECAREVDLVTTSTPALQQEYATHGRGVVIPNSIPRRLAELPPAYERESDVVTIGWTGNVFNHPYDLQAMGSGLQQALDRTRGRSRFTVLGQKWDAKDRLCLTEEPDEVDWIPDVDAYVTSLGELFDVGVAPLRLDRFNACKSWLKPMEYAARGVYSVTSPSEEYVRLGLSWRARAPKDWAKALTAAVDDPDMRRDVAARNRAVVFAEHLTEHRVADWVAAWERAIDIRSQRLRKGA